MQEHTQRNTTIIFALLCVHQVIKFNNNPSLITHAPHVQYVQILDTVHKLRDQEWEYDMEASFVEVYNNSLRDLLGGPHAPFINDQSAIKHDSNGGHTHVAGVSRVSGTGCSDMH